MSVGLRLDLQLSQQLVMTPQLQQAIRLLAMSNLELAEFVETEVEKNPLLLVQDPEIAAPPAEPAMVVPPTTADGAPAATDSVSDQLGLTREAFDNGAENLHDSSPSDGPDRIHFGGRSGPDRGGSARDGGTDLTAPVERIVSRVTLREHLLTQLGQMPGARGTISKVARHLVEELDEHGYLRDDLDEIAARVRVSDGQIRAGLQCLQSCEPTGVGARSVAECLSLQLAERNRLDPAMATLVDNLGLLARGDLKRLRALCGVDAGDLSDMLTELRALDPRPCAGFDAEEPVTVIPDILLTRTSWGGWNLELNAETLPRVLIDRTYRTRIGAAGDAEAGQFLSECQANAAWLVKSLDQRARTILRVATEIVRHQQRFFTEGIAGLQPLTLRMVADAIDMHESTVSRVTANKYMATDRGVIELKFFFSNAVSGGEGNVTATAVRHRIKALVAAESDTGVLSDDAIVDILRSEGVDIARRTVAKYRKSLNIPSSVDRRRRNSVAAGV